MKLVYLSLNNSTSFIMEKFNKFDKNKNYQNYFVNDRYKFFKNLLGFYLFIHKINYSLNSYS